MQVALLVPEMPPDSIGGGGVVFDALASRLARNGHRLVVVTSSTFRGPADPAGDRGYELIRVPEFPHPSPAYRTSMPPIPASPAFARAVAALRRADVVNAHGYACPLVDVLASFVPSRRIAFTLHGFLYLIPTRGGALGEIYKAYDAVLGSRVLRRSKIVTAVSSWVVHEAAKRGRHDVRVVPNGCTPARPAPLSARVAEEAAKGPYVLGIGRLQHFKGFEVAIEGVARLRERCRNVRLMLAGKDAGHEAELRALAQRLGVESAVSFLGFVSGEELATLLGQSVAYVLTSHSESFSLTTLEALNAGAPCVLSRYGGPLDIATDGVTALFFDDGDVAAFASCVQRLMLEPELRAGLIERGKDRARDFDWDRITERYEAVYEEIASGYYSESSRRARS
jgi:glycosyltransferase involved in cell wall biosynthesis